MSRVHPPIEERLWGRVNRNSPNGCWEWQGYKLQTGYGLIMFRGKQIGTHRVAWLLSTGIEQGQLHVLHKCDNPCCCNPDHLFLGTHQENMRDKCKKGRAYFAYGELTKNAKLTELQVKTIRQAHASGKPVLEMAKEYGVTEETIYNVVNRRTWKHI